MPWNGICLVWAAVSEKAKHRCLRCVQPQLAHVVSDQRSCTCRWMDSEELSEDEDLWAEMREFWSDGEELEGLRKAPARRARKEPRRQRGPNQPRTGGLGHSKLRHQIVTHYNAVTQVCHSHRAQVASLRRIARILPAQQTPGQ